MVERAVHDPHPFSIPEAIQGLFRGDVRAVAVSFYENERPLRGMAGWLDWYFQGAISHSIGAGRLQGSVGECAYVPVQRAGRVYHVILAGGGKLAGTSAPRPELPAPSLEALQRNLCSLGLGTIGLSRADFGGAAEEKLEKSLKGVSLWIAP